MDKMPALTKVGADILGFEEFWEIFAYFLAK